MSALSSTTVLTTARLRLRPVVEGDVRDVTALMTDRVVLRHWDDPPWEGPARFAAFLTRSRQVAVEGTGVRLVVETVDDGVFRGWCSITGVDAVHRTATLTVVLAADAWGRGYATEALGAVLDLAFDAFDLNRVQAEADTRNLACRRVLEKLGFVLEGTLREDCVVDGVVSDSHVFGLLRRDRDRSA